MLGALVRHLLDKTEILKNYSLSPDYQCRYVRTSVRACACVLTFVMHRCPVDTFLFLIYLLID